MLKVFQDFSKGSIFILCPQGSTPLAPICPRYCYIGYMYTKLFFFGHMYFIWKRVILIKGCYEDCFELHTCGVCSYFYDVMYFGVHDPMEGNGYQELVIDLERRNELSDSSFFVNSVSFNINESVIINYIFTFHKIRTDIEGLATPTTTKASFSVGYLQKSIMYKIYDFVP